MPSASRANACAGTWNSPSRSRRSTPARAGSTARRNVHAVLKREGVHVGRKRVERLMREADLAGVSPRRKGFTRRDPKATLAPDLVRRDFTAPAPNRLWVTDLTMIATGEGPLWLSAIRDAFSRRVVAWETSARADADLVLSTLEYALASREVEPGQLIHHADHGCQYTSIRPTTRMLRAGVQASMGSVGDSCADRASRRTRKLWSRLILPSSRVSAHFGPR
ncbi:DDE-type integrase/transposase/recombinase [Streptomyces sp. IB201691-2A2]|uniref:DDE-type integrase/transposase/recombinase n=1 Tax=Streptomyces sp. IB201691-2A2 TaxID=2561920 RepID=UPI0028C37F60|nr:DDE-type integrase/transposase/recombinase [Streptomyces sp. IB201691-2A2]